jgi:Raf kinase inhibitor-like YbhB/YbcL family protein
MLRWSSALALVVLCSACSSDGDDSSSGTPTTGTGAPAPALTVTSTAFADGAPIPERYSCDGANEIPPIAWSGVPENAHSVALVVDDPDAPREGGFLHWAVVGLPREGAVPPVPAGARQLENSAGQAGWTGPCPPPGNPHHYVFTVYALGGPADTVDEIRDAAVARGTLTGTYQR